MFFKKTIDSIIADITSKIENLHVVAELHAAEAAVHDAVVFERAALATFARKEAARAKSIAEKFAALVS